MSYVKILKFEKWSGFGINVNEWVCYLKGLVVSEFPTRKEARNFANELNEKIFLIVEESR